MMEEEKVCF